jgi:hypothetical protein
MKKRSIAPMKINKFKAKNLVGFVGKFDNLEISSQKSQHPKNLQT